MVCVDGDGDVSAVGTDGGRVEGWGIANGR